MERKIYEDALAVGVIDDKIYDELNTLYQLRNRVIHRYIISNIKTRDFVEISVRYSEAVESVRLILEKFENMQAHEEHDVYGKGLGKATVADESDIQRLYSGANDKHLVKRFKREISP